MFLILIGLFIVGWLNKEEKPSGNNPEKVAAVGTSEVTKAVGQSDDYDKYKISFMEAAEKLIKSGRCTVADFEQIGGWVKSSATFKDRPVYFTYCGGMTRSDRLYLDASTGEIFQ